MASKAAVQFDVWGCRGSRNLVPDRSKIGNRTSCYSVLSGDAVFVFDAGRGLAALGSAMFRERRFAAARSVHLLVTHSHMDHWEGLKDVEWFWRRGNGMAVTLYGTSEALTAIHNGFSPPSYVPLDRLAHGTAARLGFRTLQAGTKANVDGALLETFALNHYSGDRDSRRIIDTIGYRLTLARGPVLVYLSDHEPTADTLEAERRVTKGADLVVYDCHFPDRRDHAYGHGSQEHGASVARERAKENPRSLVLAGHIGPTLGDDEIRAAHRRHGQGARNFQLAVEGHTYTWSPRDVRFTRETRAKTGAR